MENKLKNDGNPLTVDHYAIEDPEFNKLVFRRQRKQEFRSDYSYEWKPELALYMFGKNTIQFHVIDSLLHKFNNGTNHTLDIADI